MAVQVTKMVWCFWRLMTRQEFIDKAWEAAVEARSGGAAISIPVAVAQAALETNYGNSELASQHNNLFGIKGDYKGEYSTYRTREQDKNGEVYWATVKFKSYPDWAKCFEDYADIVERLPWYQDAEDAAHAPKDYLRGLVAVRTEDGEVVEPGWATDHNYFNKVWNIVESHYLLQRSETAKEENIDLVVVYDDNRRILLNPTKCTLGMTNDGKPKLMVRVQPTTFLQRLRYLLGWRGHTNV